jgi:hypothetical protein
MQPLGRSLRSVAARAAVERGQHVPRTRLRHRQLGACVAHVVSRSVTGGMPCPGMVVLQELHTVVPLRVANNLEDDDGCSKKMPFRAPAGPVYKKTIPCGAAAKVDH